MAAEEDDATRLIEYASREVLALWLECGIADVELSQWQAAGSSDKDPTPPLT